jgi:hypothetical protein
MEFCKIVKEVGYLHLQDGEEEEEEEEEEEGRLALKPIITRLNVVNIQSQASIRVESLKEKELEIFLLVQAFDFVITLCETGRSPLDSSTSARMRKILSALPLHTLRFHALEIPSILISEPLALLPPFFANHDRPLMRPTPPEEDEDEDSSSPRLRRSGYQAPNPTRMMKMNKASNPYIHDS